MKRVSVYVVLLVCMLLLVACGSKAKPSSVETPAIQSALPTESVDVVSTEDANSDGSEPVEDFVANVYENGWEILPESDFIGYEVNGGMQIQYAGTANRVRFPDTLQGKPVIIIEACLHPEAIQEVILPDSVKMLGKNAFRDCKNLRSIILPEGLESIEYGAFSYTGLTEIVIPESVKEIQDVAFAGCTGLTTVTIPANVTNRMYRPYRFTLFEGCENLVEVKVSPDNPVYIDVDGVVFTKDMTQLLHYPRSKPGAYAIPDSVVEIDAGAFTNCTELTEVVVPGTVQNIYFDGCSKLGQVTLAEGVRIVSFRDCISLETVDLPETISVFNFEGCTSLKTIEVPKNVGGIYSKAFKDCVSLIKVTLPLKRTYLTRIESQAFYNCKSLPTLAIPFEDIEYIAEDAFQGCDSFSDDTWTILSAKNPYLKRKLNP